MAPLMGSLRAFGCYLPSRVVTNAELAPMVGVDPSWLLNTTGIEERRFAAPEESVAGMAVLAARDCLSAAGLEAAAVGMILLSSGSAPRRFPGPAAEVASALGIAGTPAIDLPIASAGTLFGLSLAAGLCRDYGNVLVIGSEIMSRAVRFDPEGRATAILFGDGAGACLVSREGGFAAIAGSVLHSDGEFASALRLELDGPMQMDGRTIILQAGRKLPRAIQELLAANNLTAAQVGTYLMHQANLNLITRVAQALEVPESRFFRNIQSYGNTSSASLLIAAAEWWKQSGHAAAEPVVFSAFGAGLHWGALLALPA